MLQKHKTWQGLQISCLKHCILLKEVLEILYFAFIPSLRFFLCSLTTHYENIPEIMNCLFIMLWLKYISHYVGRNETDEEKRTCTDLFLAGGLNNINFRAFHLPPPSQLCAPSILSAVKWVSF